MGYVVMCYTGYDEAPSNIDLAIGWLFPRKADAQRYAKKFDKSSDPGYPPSEVWHEDDYAAWVWDHGFETSRDYQLADAPEAILGF